MSKNRSICITVTATLAIAVASAEMPSAAQTQRIGKQIPAVMHNTWTSGAEMPTASSCSMVGVLEGEIYVVGGENPDNVVIADTQIYNPTTNTWRTGVPLPTPLCDGIAAVVNNILYVTGGWEHSGGKCTKALWAYSPKTNQWTSKSAMPTAKCSMGIAVQKNIIYAIGGIDNDNRRLTTVESYNQETDTWRKKAPLLVGKSDITAGLVAAMIVAADGYESDGDFGDNEGYRRNPNTWTSFMSDPTPRNAACGGGIGGEMYVAGGYPGGPPGTPAMSLTESFNVSTNTWETLVPMPQAAMWDGAAASAVYQGKLYCFGGWSSYVGTVLGNVQIYQP